MPITWLGKKTKRADYKLQLNLSCEKSRADAVSEPVDIYVIDYND